MNKKTTIALIGVASLLFSGLAQASALLRITPIGVTVSEQDDTGQTSPVPISVDDNGFRLSYWGNGNQDPVIDPVLVILATPEGSAMPGLTDGPGSEPSGLTASVSTSNTGYYGGSWGSDGYAGVYDADTAAAAPGSGSIYDFLGLAFKGNGSQNYSNWADNDEGVTSWTIWVFQVAFDPDFGQGDWNEFASTNLVSGSYIVGYGCTGAEVITDACDAQGKTKHTPFTFTGYVVPEPGTVGLLGLGLIAIGLVRRRRIG